MTSRPRSRLMLTLTTLGSALLIAAPAGAQQEPAKPVTDMERAKKQADAVFHWIKLNGDKGASRQPPAPAPAPVARRPATAPAAAPIAATPKPAPVVQQTPAVPAPAPTPAIAQAAPEPAPEPVVIASAAPTPAPEAPLAVAAQVTAPAAPPEDEVETPLKLLVKVEPVYPPQLRQQNVQRGVAQVQFTVAADGTVSEAKAVSASNTRFGSAAVQAIRQWRFAPIAKERLMAVEVAFTNSAD